MTTPPHPQSQPSGSSNNSTRGRKRPAPGTSAPVLSSVPATAEPTVITDSGMNYLNLPAAPVGITSAGPGGNLYPASSGLADTFLAGRSDVDQNTAATQAGAINLPITANDSAGRLARINRTGNTLIRMPYPLATAGAMAQGLAAPGVQMNLLNGSGGATNMGQVMGSGPQSDGLDPFDRELHMRIEKMRKKRASIPPFVQKLSSFVNDPKTDALIRWSPSGNSFLVLDEDEFSRTLIPDLFKHNNYASFVRQLNMYGFHKVVGLADGSLKTSEQRSKPPSEYENPYFKRGQPDLMWLISKPKGKPNKKRKNKQDPDTDKEDELSDGGEGEFGAGGVGVGGYLEGPKADNQGDGHHQQGGGGGRGSRPDLQALIQQLEAVKNHQAMISAAINRLRKDHNQLYEQSVAFQTLHDRHEHSISAILTFLATVYDKSLGGHINGAFNNLFTQNQVEHGHGLHSQGVGSVVGNAGGAIVTPARPAQAVVRTPQMTRRRQLLLENGPMAGQISEEDSNPGISSGNNQPLKPNGSSVQNFQAYQSPSIQELVTPTHDNRNPSPRQEQQQQQQQQQQQHQHHSSNLQNYPSPIFSLPDSPTAQSTPQMGRPSTSPVLAKSSLTPRSFNRGLPGSGVNSKGIQDHNAQMVQKAKEIEDLEELQAVQNGNVEGLMDMIQNYASHDDGNNVDGTGLSGNIDEYLNWGMPSTDLGGGDTSIPNFDMGVDGQQIGEVGDIVDELFGFDKDIQDPNALSASVGDSGMGQILGTNPSTVAPSPATSSVGSRPREELEEDVEEVTPKRRRLG
ncbi:hypothetical protein HOY80DRAFT_1036288 [Tuber brumale]|nr:hypothetical protein HOY80DRAFT_1036288 [Tuber brumale]